MNLCDSCKKWEGCDPIWRNDTMTGEHGCGHYAPITRADLAARDAEIAGMRDEIESVRRGWKDLAEAPRKHQGMMVSLRGFILRVSEYLDRKDQGGDAFVLREIQRNLCEVWSRRGEPGIVSEFGALYCLDKDGPIEEIDDDDDDDDDESTEGAKP